MRAGETARPDAANLQDSRHRGPGFRRWNHSFRLFGGILKNRRVGISGPQFGVSALALFKRVAEVQQRIKADGTGCREIEERLHISALGPADIADWIIVPRFLVARIIAAGTI